MVGVSLRVFLDRYGMDGIEQLIRYTNDGKSLRWICSIYPFTLHPIDASQLCRFRKRYFTNSITFKPHAKLEFQDWIGEKEKKIEAEKSTFKRTAQIFELHA